MNELDSHIINAVKHGDLAALEQVILYYQKPIFNHIYRFTSQKDDAADLTQETFIKLYKNRKFIDPDLNFRAWLYKIATNTVYDWLKKKKRHSEILFAEEDEIETNVSEAAYYSIETAELMDIEMALEKIKPQYKNVLILYYQQGFDYKEIAEILSTPIGTVKTLMHRAKKSLAEKLG